MLRAQAQVAREAAAGDGAAQLGSVVLVGSEGRVRGRVRVWARVRVRARLSKPRPVPLLLPFSHPNSATNPDPHPHLHSHLSTDPNPNSFPSPNPTQVDSAKSPAKNADGKLRALVRGSTPAQRPAPPPRTVGGGQTHRARIGLEDLDLCGLAQQARAPSLTLARTLALALVRTRTQP